MLQRKKNRKSNFAWCKHKERKKTWKQTNILRQSDRQKEAINFAVFQTKLHGESNAQRAAASRPIKTRHPNRHAAARWRRRDGFVYCDVTLRSYRSTARRWARRKFEKLLFICSLEVCKVTFYLFFRSLFSLNDFFLWTSLFYKNKYIA